MIDILNITVYKKLKLPPQDTIIDFHKDTYIILEDAYTPECYLFLIFSNPTWWRNHYYCIIDTNIEDAVDYIRREILHKYSFTQYLEFLNYSSSIIKELRSND